MRYAAFYSKRQLKLAWWSLYNVHRTLYSLAGGNCKVHIVHRTAQPINFVFIVAASLLRLDCAIRVVASAPRRECCPQVARLVPPGGRQIGRITAPLGVVLRGMSRSDQLPTWFRTAYAVGYSRTPLNLPMPAMPASVIMRHNA